ncbi:MAG: M1 family metallopeptidase [Pseudomonadota bacterium]|nr:M1 family metallopeptidase [Pseudomonadota bacterium]
MTASLRLILSAAAAAALLAGCASGGADDPRAAASVAPVAAAQPIQLPRDVHSFARPEIARVTHVDLDLRTDFLGKRITGTAALDVQTAPGAREIVLDTRDLTIRQVTDGAGRPLVFNLGQGAGVRGRPLTVQLPENTRRIIVHYATAPGAAALQWLSPEQTAGKRHPYLFSQGQAILTRSWIPTQDSPGIRQTYSARVVVPENLRAVMSAEMLTPRGERLAKAEGAGRAYRFRMNQPIPPYLIALAVGDIEFRKLGPRSGVYTEPVMLDRAARELVDVEKMIAAAERLYGPYRWGRYDLLVLPPSFPYGGMENPRLTFATPTIIAGDRSLVSLVAHELAHSWSGNLVTNAVWADSWLNEGFTTYFENRIMEALYGRERAAMEAALEYRTLRETIAGLPAGSKRSALRVETSATDPDEEGSAVIYEKGQAFLRTIENIAGRDRFDAWLRSYFDRHAFQPMTTEAMLADMRANLIRGDAELERRLKLEEWIYQPGIPDNVVVPSSSAFAAVEVQARAFANGTPAAQLKTGDWTTQEWLHFLGAIPQELPDARLADLDRAFDLSTEGNSEILFAWLQLGVKNRYDPIKPHVERFLLSQGRRKFVLPLFRSLMAQGDWGRPFAQQLYARARPGYHPVTSTSVDAVMRPAAG